MVECLNIHPNMHIIEALEGGREKNSEVVVFKEIMIKNVPTMTRHQARDSGSAKSPSRINTKKITPRNIIVNL